MRVIAFAGLAQAGKTTAVDELCQWALEPAGRVYPVRLHFAGPLKEALAIMGARKGGKRDALYRTGAQLIGTMMRDPDTVPGITGPDYWVNVLREKLEQAAAEEDARLTTVAGPFRETIVLIDDVRYLNEVEMIRKWQGNIIFIDAFRRLKIDLDEEPWRRHHSEGLAMQYTFGSLEDELFDCTLTNNSDEAAFRRVVRSMASAWCGLVTTPKG